MQRLENVFDFVHDRLPLMNLAVEEGRLDHVTFAGLVRPVIGRLAQTVASTPGGAIGLAHKEARDGLALLDFIVGSTERHFQVARHKPGEGLAEIGGAESLMLLLGRLAAHPPKGSAYTRWIWNSRGLSFTADPQELLFDDVVRVTDALVDSAAMHLREVTSKGMDPRSEHCVELLQSAASMVRRCHPEYERLRARSADGRTDVVFRPEFFAKRMRLYLPTYPIAGRAWGGVSAANLRSFWSLDFLAGTVSAEPLFSIGGSETNYRQLVEAKSINIPGEEIEVLHSDMNQGSMADWFHHAVGLDADYARYSTEALATAVDRRIEILPAVKAYADLVRAWGSLAAYHLALIKSHLVKVSETMSDKDVAALPVSPARGSGGLQLEEVKAMVFMRQRHPVVAKIVQAVELVDRSRRSMQIPQEVSV